VGNPIVYEENVKKPFRYSGELTDQTTTLQYHARWYNPSLGRFINEDTYEGQIDNFTARKAWEAYGGAEMLPESNNKLQKMLASDKYFNILTIGLVLIDKAKSNNIDISGGTNEQWFNVLPYYNTSMKNPDLIAKGNNYAAQIQSYLPYINILLNSK
jgi:RHS repeat-associated protein